MEDYVVCKQYFYSEGTQSSFVESSSEKEKIENFYDGNSSHSPSRISASVLYVKTEDSVIKQEKNEYGEECMKSKFAVESLEWKDQYQITTESIDIKSEEESESGINDRSSPSQKSVSKTHMYKCLYCNYEQRYKKVLKNHIEVFHGNVLLDPEEKLKIKQIFEKKVTHHCDKCSFATAYGNRMRRHQLIHKDPSQVRMYKCDKCNYECKYSSSLKSHQLRHKDSSQVKMYKCDECNFVSKYRNNLETHKLRHKDSSQVPMYKCDKCDFETKYKENVKTHQLWHRSPSKEEMYQCDKCSFASKYWNSLKTHKLRHKDPSQVTMYKCDQCSYESMYRSSLKSHLLLQHRDPAQVEMYKCDKCDFESKYKHNVGGHYMAKHKRLTGVTK